VSYLKEVVEARPEVQVIMTTHSDEIVAACDPEDLVVLRRDNGLPVARTIKTFNLANSKLEQARRHLDVTRSASLFASRAVLVEGITDAAVLRAMARRWARTDRVRRRFVESLTITVAGSRIGPWLPSLLTKDGSELVDRLAILRDTDGDPEPRWVTNTRSARFDVFFSDPTLEPSITPGNEALVRDLLAEIGVAEEDLPDDDDDLPAWVARYFKKKGKAKKADFADAFVTECRDPDVDITMPDHINDLLEFLWDGFLPVVEDDSDSDDE
jgi:putative ATP-dependent endonuclease of OLD family